MRSGAFDRRISIEAATFAPDSAGDQVPTWAEAFKRWAKVRDFPARQSVGAGQIVRDYDAEWIVRLDTQTIMIGPETHRLVWRDRVYEIVGVMEATEQNRGECVTILTATTPNQRGAVAPGG